MVVEAVDGAPLCDAIDWYWLSSEESIELAVGVKELKGTHNLTPPLTPLTRYQLTRTQGEGWGIEFASPVFDGVRTCKNACVFCFMGMLPKGMRPSLYLRDDDYRLSFLQGNFVTLTNLDAADVERIVRYQLSPLHVSLHAVRPAAREKLMGKNQARGLEVLQDLLAQGIEVHAQIVLVPGLNDGAELTATLSWIKQHPGIRSVGIVPYGYTRYAKLQGSYNNPKDAQRIIEQVAPYQQCAQTCETCVQLSDEFYLKAYPNNIPARLPQASDYNGFPQYQDGIGLLRVFIDDWCRLQASYQPRPEQLLGEEPHISLVTGAAFAPVIRDLLRRSPFANTTTVLAVENRFFGGNVDVAGLLTARDVIEQAADARGTLLLPAVMFNADGLTLDGYTLEQIRHALGSSLSVVSCTADGLLDALGSLRDENYLEGLTA
jgi:putative radical SAM enzyme (TIGR03279 family)